MSINSDNRKFKEKCEKTYKNEKDIENISNIASIISSIDFIYGAYLEPEDDREITVKFLVHRVVDIKKLLYQIMKNFVKSVEISVEEIKENGRSLKGRVVVLWVHFHKTNVMKTEFPERKKIEILKEEYATRTKKYRERKRYIKIPAGLEDKIGMGSFRLIEDIIFLFMCRDDDIDIPDSKFYIPNDMNDHTAIKINIPDSHFRVDFDFFRLIIAKYIKEIHNITVDPDNSELIIKTSINAKRPGGSLKNRSKRNK